jgi:subtilisin family serine protease
VGAGQLYLILLVLLISPVFGWAQAGQPFVQGEIIVKLKGKQFAAANSQFMSKTVATKGMALKTSWSGVNMHHLQLKAGDNVLAQVAELKNDPDVEYAEPNYIVTQFQTPPGEVEGTPYAWADAQSVSQYSGSGYGLSSAPIRLTDAWGILASVNREIIVAVIDSGVDYNHSVFVNSNAIWANPVETVNGIDDDGNGYVDDIRGWNFAYNNNNPMDDGSHGTHVAGTIVGVGQDIFATTLNPSQIKIMPLKFLNDSGSGSIADAVTAMYYAVNNGAKVINNSWGGSTFSFALQDAVKYAYDNRVVVVAASGNSAINIDVNPIYPAGYPSPGLISVAATTSSDGFASFSNFGTGRVHIAAPGAGIYSTLPNNTVGYMSGTSMAAPFVAGLAALMLREQPTMNAFQVRSLMLSSSSKLSNLTARVSSGGRIDAYAAVLAAKVSGVDSTQPVYQTMAGSDTPSRATSSTSSGGSGGGCGLVAAAFRDKDGGGFPPGAALVLVILFAPVAVYSVLRHLTFQERREHTRFHVDSEVKISVGDRELVGQMTSLSLGGVQLATEAWLAQGGEVKLAITSPDGQQTIEVTGQVVWSEREKRYGVKFANMEDSLRSTLQSWMRNMRVQAR